MIWTDRSRIETGFRCPRKRFHNYVAGGRGYVPAVEPQDLWFGQWMHAGIELAVTGKPVDVPPLVTDELTADGLSVLEEWRALFSGLYRTFRGFTLPQLLDEYEWISSEQEVATLLAPDVTLMNRLDGVLRRKADGVYFVLEAKTSSWVSKLIEQSRSNFQLLLECEALRRSLPEGVEVGGAVLLVFDKGQRKKDYCGEGHRRLSPFTYCYSRERADGSTEYALEYRAGWTRTPTWTIDGWYDILVERRPEVVKAQVCTVPAVDFDRERTESVMRQVVAIEHRLAEYRCIPSLGMQDSDIDEYYPQNFASCADTYGRRCEYWDLCFSPRIAADPLASGEWRIREPNHRIEFDHE